MARTPRAFTQMRTQHLECRHLNHAWQVRQAIVQAHGEVECEFYCSRCRGSRFDTYQRRNGELLRRHYVYPDAYLVSDLESWGGRSTFNGNVRTELVGRYVRQTGSKR